MTYLFEDWKSGKRPPKGWDCADAIKDGWTPADIMAFMRGTVRDWEPVKKNSSITEPEPAVEPVIERAAENAVTSNSVPCGVSALSGYPEFMPVLYHDSETEIAKLMIGMIERTCRSPMVKADGEFWVWGPTAWQPITKMEMSRLGYRFDRAEIVGKPNPLKVGNKFVENVLSIAGNMVADDSFFDDPLLGVNVRNGVVTVDDKGGYRVLPHEPDQRFRFTIDAEFELHTETHPPEGSMLHRLIHGAFKGDPDEAAKIDLVGEILGAAVFGMATKVKQPKAFIFLGETASNGKSTIASLLSVLLPPGSVSSIAPGQMGEEKFVVGLAGKLANVADELSANAISGEAFKSVVTGNPVTGRDVYKSMYTFKPRAINVFTTNVLPRFSGGIDRGLRRRLVVLTFNRTIPENEIIEDITERIQRDELDLLLGFAIAGAQRLKRNNGYTIPASTKAAMQEWLLLDPLNEWFAMRVVTATREPFDGWLRTPKLFEDFKQWATDNGYSPQFLPPVNTFAQRLKAFDGVHIERRSSGSVAAGILLATPGKVVDHEPEF